MVRKAIITAVVSLLTASVVHGQAEKEVTSPSVPAVSDSLVADSTHLPRRESDIETELIYSARDSISARITDQIVMLYGDASATYGDISLEAERLIIDYRHQTITALYSRDSLGNFVGYPIFKEGGQVYETKGIIYNYATGRARINELVTRQGESFLKTGTANKSADDNILSLDNVYTTCDLEHPHFKIKARKAKAIKDDKVVTGPFLVELDDVPLPIGFLFGIFPGQKESASGIIVPSYGEEQSRGFNLRGGGYFFDISDYMKLAITSDFYSKGAHALYLNSNYSVRYRFNGAFNLSYSKNFTSTDIENRSSIKDYRIAWTHSPLGKGTSRFFASVDAATATFNENNNLTYPTTDIYSSSLSNISATLNSTVGYSTRFSGTPLSMGTNFSFSQNLQTREVNMRLPNLNVTMQNLYPFQRKSKKSLLDNLSIGYTMAANSLITNNLGDQDSDGRDSIASFDFNNLSLFLSNSRRGVRHTIPISNSLTILRYIVLSQSISYEEKWYFEKLNWIQTDNRFKSDTVSGFNRIANYSFSVGMTSRVFGMYFIKNKHRSIKAIRHVLNPNMSFSYTPDFTSNNEYFQKFIDERGGLIMKARHEGFLYGPSIASQSAVIGFGVGNTLEMKVKSPKDTAERKVMLLNNFSVSTSYNLLADAFHLAPLSMAANTNIFRDKVNANVSGTLDPYQYIMMTDAEGNSSETRVDVYSWKYGGIGRITSGSLSLNANLNPEKQKSDNKTRETIGKADVPSSVKQHLLQDQSAYVDFSIPWSLNLGYHLAYSHPVNRRPSVTQTVQAAGDLSISTFWKVTYNTGYDLKNNAFTQTSLGLARDLHCWTMNLYWIPFGKFQSYNFSISCKASILRDAKVEKRRSFTDQ
jgi:hypothetical protein